MRMLRTTGGAGRREMTWTIAAAALALTALPADSGAQRATALGERVRPFVSVSEPVVALTHVKLIDGTGSAPKNDQTIILRDGKIAQVGPAASVAVRQGARGVDLNGHTVIPGLVGVHDHLFYT